MTTALPLMKNVVTSLVKIILVPLGLTAAASLTDPFGLSMTPVIISIKKMDDIMKTVKYLEESGLIINDICKTIKNKAKEQKGGFFGMLLGILAAIYWERCKQVKDQ